MAIEDLFYDELDVDLKELIHKEFWADELPLRDSEEELLRKYELLLEALIRIPYVALLPMASIYYRVKKHMKKAQEIIKQADAKRVAVHQKELPAEIPHEMAA